MGFPDRVLSAKLIRFSFFGSMNTCHSIRRVCVLTGFASRLHGSRLSSTCHPSHLVRHLQTRIKANGPMTVAEYMKEVLTNPVSGYYMHKDVFGEKGDFTTSPEISQMFGELIGIWCVNEWMIAGSPPALQVVELGPGRGTLAEDMLRVFSQFKRIRDVVSLHLVEVSPKLCEVQEEKLSDSSSRNDETQQNSERAGPHYWHCMSKYNVPVFWYKELHDVPRGFVCLIAHEFFDALPIHKFQKTEKGWCEMFVDVDSDPSSGKDFKFVLSRGATAAVTALLKVLTNDNRDHIELCSEGGAIVQEIANRISRDGGCGLIADYGHNGDKTDTFRAFKDHQLHDVLTDPGSADLTADVDFSYFKSCIGSTVSTFGPISQEEFLHNMGIKLRLNMLLQKAHSNHREDLISGYDMLTNPQKMGERFKFFSLMRTKSKSYIPGGFTPLT